MSYCTEDDLIIRFGEDELIDATGRGATTDIESDPLEGAISDSDGVIERHLRGRYKLPIEGNDELVLIACDLTRYYLWGISAPEHVKERYEAALKALRDLARGVTVLDEEPADSGTGPRQPVVIAPDQIFTADKLKKVSLI